MLAAIWHLINEIWSHRSHIRIIFKGRFRAAYSGTGLGIFWNYALPVVPLTVYWFLSVLRVFPNFEGVDGATFITFGVTLWFLFAGCIQIPMQVIQSRNKESMKANFPLSASIVSEFAQLLFDTLVRVILVSNYYSFHTKLANFTRVDVAIYTVTGSIFIYWNWGVV